MRGSARNVSRFSATIRYKALDWDLRERYVGNNSADAAPSKRSYTTGGMEASGGDMTPLGLHAACPARRHDPGVRI